jgi:hypothetical protein
MNLLEWFQQRVHGPGSQPWPPTISIDRHWAGVASYRRRFDAGWEELLPYNTWINATASRAASFSPVPLARELGRYSAALLFSDPAKITYDDNADMLDELLEVNGLDPFWQATAERVAIEGSGGLRVIRDDEVAEGLPYLTFVPEDRVLWKVVHGRAVQGGICVFEWRPENRLGQSTEVWRLLESHEPFFVTREVWRGTVDRLGQPVPFESRPEEWAGLEEVQDTGLDVPTLIKWDNTPSAASDIQGLELLLDRYDEGMSLLVDKARKSSPNVFVNRKLADEQGFVDLTQFILTQDAGGGKGAVKANLGDGTGRSVEVAQPGLQARDHIDFLRELREQIVTTAGYSAASWALDEGGIPESGTALEKKLARTLSTRAAKERMAREAITNALAAMLAWHDGNGSPRQTRDYRVEVQFGTGLPFDASEKANELNIRKSAGFVSLRQALREQHPAWSEDQIEDEVEEIKGDRERAAEEFAARSAQQEDGFTQDDGKQDEQGGGEQSGT